MEILVCIKQVPGTTQVEVDEKTGVLKRDGIASKNESLRSLRFRNSFTNERNIWR